MKIGQNLKCLTRLPRFPKHIGLDAVFVSDLQFIEISIVSFYLLHTHFTRLENKNFGIV